MGSSPSREVGLTFGPGPVIVLPKPRPQWMKALEDFYKISMLSLPGAYQSPLNRDTGERMDMGRCWVLPEQLDAGVRFLSISCWLQKDGTLKLPGWHHQGTLDDALDICQAFLTNNPSEFIIASIYPNGGGDIFADAINKCLKKHEGWLYQDSAIPTIGQVRGKIVVLTQEQSVTGLHWHQPDIHVSQDMTHFLPPPSAEMKWKSITESLDEAGTGGKAQDMYITYAVDWVRYGGPPHNVPFYVDFDKKLKEYARKDHIRRLGVVILGNPHEAIITDLIRRCFTFN